MKKYLNIIICAALVFALTGCGNKENTENKENLIKVTNLNGVTEELTITELNNIYKNTPKFEDEYFGNVVQAEGIVEAISTGNWIIQKVNGNDISITCGYRVTIKDYDGKFDINACFQSDAEEQIKKIDVGQKVKVKSNLNAIVKYATKEYHTVDLIFAYELKNAKFGSVTPTVTVIQ